MSVVRMKLGRLVREADGFEGVEYAAMTAMIVGAIIGALISLGVAVSGNFGTITQVVQI
jgi:Flp pilus assembly pilin Flp